MFNMNEIPCVATILSAAEPACSFRIYVFTVYPRFIEKVVQNRARLTKSGGWIAITKSSKCISLKRKYNNKYIFYIEE